MEVGYFCRSLLVGTLVDVWLSYGDHPAPRCLGSPFVVVAKTTEFIPVRGREHDSLLGKGGEDSNALRLVRASIIRFSFVSLVSLVWLEWCRMAKRGVWWTDDGIFVCRTRMI